MTDSMSTAMPALRESAPPGRAFGFVMPLPPYSGGFTLPGFGYPDCIYTSR